jgi:hypothetical protein
MVRDAFASQGHEPPFELRVLEVALDMVSAHLEQLATQLDAQAQMALDNLTKQVGDPRRLVTYLLHIPYFSMVEFGVLVFGDIMAYSRSF